MIGVMIGLVLLMIGQVTGRGPKMTGTGPMTGLGGSQEWWSAEQPSASALPGLQSTANALQDSVRNEPSQDVAAVTVGSQEQNAARPSRTVRGFKPGLQTNMFVGACLLACTLSAGMPSVCSKNVPENDDTLVRFHLQAGLVDKSWITVRQWCLRELLSGLVCTGLPCFAVE